MASLCFRNFGSAQPRELQSTAFWLQVHLHEKLVPSTNEHVTHCSMCCIRSMSTFAKALQGTMQGLMPGTPMSRSGSAPLSPHHRHSPSHAGSSHENIDVNDNIKVHLPPSCSISSEDVAQAADVATGSAHLAAFCVLHMI